VLTTKKFRKIKSMQHALVALQ